MAPAQNQRLEQLEGQYSDLQSSMQTVMADGKKTEERMTAIERALKESMATVTGNLVKLEEEIRRGRMETQPPVVGLETSGNSFISSGSQGNKNQNIGFSHGREDGGGMEEEGFGKWKFRKLDLPLFEGTNPDGWVMRMERYFRYSNLDDGEKVEAAVMALEGDALLWFQFEDDRRPISRWDELKRLVLRKFRSSEGGSLVEQWLGHSHNGDFQEYCRRYIELLAPLKGIQDDVAMGQFIQGLSEEIKLEVRTLGPKSLEDAMEKAARVAERCGHLGVKRNWAFNPTGGRPPQTKALTSSFSQNPFQKHYNTGQNPLTWSPRGNSSSAQSNHHNYTSNPQAQRGQYRRLSERELKEKREKGLCFRCDGKWSLGHQCLKSEMSVLLMADGGVENVEELEEYEEQPVAGIEETVQTQLSMNSLVGLTSPKTMKMKGKIDGKDVVVMIDPGATHNFLSTVVVEKLEIPVVANGVFEVSLGNGDAVRGFGECQAVALELGSTIVVEDFYPLSLGNSDVVLGVQWLQKLGPVENDWGALTMKFT